MHPKYSEKTLLKVCYAVAAVVIAVVAGCAFVINKVLDTVG